MNRISFLSIMCILMQGCLGNLCASEEERYAVVTQVVTADEVTKATSSRFYEHAMQDRFKRHLAKAYQHAAQGKDRNLVNQELLKAVTVAFYSLYWKFTCRAFPAKIDSIVLGVCERGYLDIPSSAWHFMDEVEDRTIPGIMLTSFSNSQDSAFVIRNLAYDRVRATLWHELGHYALQHFLKQNEYAELLNKYAKQVKVAFSMACAVAVCYAWHDIDSLLVNYIALGACLTGIQQLVAGCVDHIVCPWLINRKYRQHEYEADAWGYLADDIHDAMIIDHLIDSHRAKILQTSDLYDSSGLLRVFLKALLRVAGYYDHWNHTHPTAEDRVMVLIQKRLALSNSSQQWHNAYKRRIKEKIKQATDEFLKVNVSIENLSRDAVENIVVAERDRICSVVDVVRPTRKSKCCIIV